MCLLVLKMYTDLFFFVLAAVPALTSVIKEEISSCSADEFSCGDGTCVSYSAFCDGVNDCFNGADEACTIGSNALSSSTILNRSRRQLPTCRLSQWQCRDGSCISFDGKCDGVVNCPDGSDETHALCRDRQCQNNWFRCTYGACVDGTAPCNGIQECADNSDELLPRCRNETEEIMGLFKCQDGRSITADKHCDGVKDCADGSDETLRTCAGKTCLSYLFQCAYGACVDQGADCNGVRECADGSDEDNVLCEDRTGVVPTRPSGACVLPEYPAHGSYVVSGVRNAQPGQSFPAVQLNYTCAQGYGIIGRSDIICTDGWWSEKSHPKCIRFCKLKPHPSVEYKCVLSGSSQGFRKCNEYEPHGTNVQPECVRPNYYSDEDLRYMTCYENGDWNYSPKCSAGLVKNGTNITVIVKDKVEIFVSNFEYAAPIPTEENVVNYNIDETDWRIGGAEKTTQQRQVVPVRPYGEGEDAREPQRLPIGISGLIQLRQALQRHSEQTTKSKGEAATERNSQDGRNITNVNFNIFNSSVVVTPDPYYRDKIIFRD